MTVFMTSLFYASREPLHTLIINFRELNSLNWVKVFEIIWKAISQNVPINLNTALAFIFQLCNIFDALKCKIAWLTISKKINNLIDWNWGFLIITYIIFCSLFSSLDIFIVDYISMLYEKRDVNALAEFMHAW